MLRYLPRNHHQQYKRTKAMLGGCFHPLLMKLIVPNSKFLVNASCSCQHRKSQGLDLKKSVILHTKQLVIIKRASNSSLCHTVWGRRGMCCSFLLHQRLFCWRNTKETPSFSSSTQSHPSLQQSQFSTPALACKINANTSQVRMPSKTFKSL